MRLVQFFRMVTMATPILPKARKEDDSMPTKSRLTGIHTFTICGGVEGAEVRQGDDARLRGAHALPASGTPRGSPPN